MSSIMGRILEARHALWRQSAKRWAERTAQREEGLRRIRDKGIGAADTPKRQVEWTAREARKVSGTSRFTERTINGTWDPVPFAPSVQAGKAAAPVARIVTLPGRGYEPQGVATGFLVHPCLLLTNHHVFQVRGDAAGFAANFHHVRDDKGVRPGKHYELDPERFFFSDARLDFALVAVKERGLENELLSELGFLRLVEATGKVLTGQPVNLVQHPGGGERQFAISDNKLVDILDSGYLQYEADTDRGSSGSPVFNTDWELVGLHHSAVPRLNAAGEIMTQRGGVWQEDGDETEIAWVANEGTRVSFIVERLRAAQVSVAEQPLLQALLASTSDPVQQPAAYLESASPSTPLTGAMPMGPVQFNFSGPVTIHQYFGEVPGGVRPAAGAAPAPAPVVAVVAAAAPPAPAAAEKTLVFDPGYAERKGYDRRFLGRSIAPPQVVDADLLAQMYSIADYQAFHAEYADVPELDLSEAGDTAQPLELRYHHYSLAMNKKAMMCQWTASNVDYRDIARQDTRPRAALGGENWRPDPRVPPDCQLYNQDIYQPARRVDRGHVVRREDNCWGAPGLETEYANSDTYHWTNCTPQHEAFNQERPRDGSGQNVYAPGTTGIWGHFEVELAKQIEAGGGKAVLFAGPVFQGMLGAQGLGTAGVKVPARFWKVVVVRASRRNDAPLQAYGYVFDQTPAVKAYGLTYEGLELPEFKAQRATLAQIQVLAGVVFDPQVLAADQAQA